MKFILPTLIVVLLWGLSAGCMFIAPPRTHYQAMGESWIDAPISQVIESWGKPTTITPKASGLADYEWYWWSTIESTEPVTQTHVVQCVTKMRVDGNGLVEEFIFGRGYNDRCDLRPPLPGRMLPRPTQPFQDERRGYF